MVGVEEGARISLSRGYVLSREYFPSSSVFFILPEAFQTEAGNFV